MSGQRSNKFLLTQSLLSSWQYALKGGEWDEFLSTLRREKKPQSKAILDGIRFENMVHAVSEGAEIGPEQEWYRPVVEICEIISQGQYQVKASRPLVVDGVEFVCYGILDFLKAGVIYDTKFSKTYRIGKYLDSPQHPMYFYLCPEVRRFVYIISDGSYVYREAYLPEDTDPIEKTVRQFMSWLDRTNLVDLYCQNWRSKYA